MQPTPSSTTFFERLIPILFFWTLFWLAVGRASAEEVRIPDMLVKMTAAEAPVHALVVEKESQSLYLYAVDSRSGFVQVARMPCSTGKVKGGKQETGDMKTPQGVYFLTGKYPDRDLAPLYGIAAYPLDYPHLLDRLAGRNGYNIWLHGTNRELKARDSNGCIALANVDLARLDAVIVPQRTAVLIAERLSWVVPAAIEEVSARLSALIEGWRAAVETGSYHDVLTYYAPGYLPPIDWWRQWHALRREMQADHRQVALGLERVDMYRYEGGYVIRFDLRLTSAGMHADAGSRKLFVAAQGERLRFVGDEYLLPAGSRQEARPDPLVAAAGELKARQARPEEQIAEFVDRWLAAWSAKDIDGYGRSYAADFRSDGMDRKAWIAYKDRLNRKYRFIRVSRGQLTVVEKSASRATVRFAQTYASNAFHTEGTKTLILKREAGQWKIHRELWQRR